MFDKIKYNSKNQIQESKQKIKSYKIFITSLILAINIFLLIFCISFFGFPEIQIPKMWKIIGGIGLVLYWFFFGSLMISLSSITGLSGVSTSEILKDIFRIGKK